MNKELYKELIDLLKRIDEKIESIKKAFSKETDINKKKEYVKIRKVLYQNYTNLSYDLYNYKIACDELEKLEQTGDKDKIENKRKEVKKLEEDLIAKYRKKGKTNTNEEKSKTGATVVPLKDLQKQLKNKKKYRVKSIANIVKTGIALGIATAATLVLGGGAIGLAGLTIHACLNAATTAGAVLGGVSYGALTALTGIGAVSLGGLGVKNLYTDTKAEIGRAKTAKVDIEKLNEQINAHENPLSL